MMPVDKAALHPKCCDVLEGCDESKAKQSVSKTGLGVCDGLQTGWLILGRGACPELGEHPEIFLLKLHEI